MKNQLVKKISFSAIMIALSTVLSLIKIFQLPLGGSITLLSMLPVCLISVIYGFKVAVVPCLAYGAIQMMIGGVFGWGLTPVILIGAIFLDYLFAFGALSLSGIFRKKSYKGIIAGVFLASFVRFLFHFVSGCIFWTNMDQFSLFGNTFENMPVLYSICYNAFYMLPEAVITCIGAYIIVRVPVIQKLIKKNTI